jgi:GWxTD domain-containing protein
MGLVVCALAAPALAQKGADREALLQPFLDGELTQWLVGAIGRMADKGEIEEYMGLVDNDEAELFIERFWSRRDATPDTELNEMRVLFDQRSAEADRLYSEAAYAGRRTDRGMTFVLYGEPEKVEYEQFLNVDEPDVELWYYSKKAEKGLDGRRPERRYRFARRGDLTTFYRARDPDDPRNRLGRPPSFGGIDRSGGTPSPP